MGDLKEWSPSGVANLTRCNSILTSECWEQAEIVTKEIISCVRPTVVSDCRRKEVIEFVQNLIRSSLGCEVFPFGSVPLQTYLPDGDIDLTSFGVLNVKDALAESVFAVLQDVEHSMKSRYVVKDVQLIRAEVKIVKCLVQNIVVDISFNQLGGLCTLCFLEQVDRLIGKDHLFKRSIILIKAWCYYESRVLGAHHGLISTYALETLVLYIFHVFHSSLTGPLAVLYKFLDYFSKFDWDNYCVSLSGPICISSFPEVTVEATENCADLLLNNDFLRECLNKFSVSSGTSEVISRAFQMKHLNIVDPLKNNNNLGRSVSKGNFFRIRSAFLYGARKLGVILSEKTEDLPGEVQKFFASTLDRHGHRQRPDVGDPALLLHTLDEELTTLVSEPFKLNIMSERGRLACTELSENGREVNGSPASSQEFVPPSGKVRAAPHLYCSPTRNEDNNISNEDPLPRCSNSDSLRRLHISNKDSRNKTYTTQVEQGNGGRMPTCYEDDPTATCVASSKPDSCRESTSNKGNDALVPTDSLADLGGDYESNLRNLQQGRWFYKRALIASYQSMQPVIPSQMAFRPNIFPPVSPGSNGVHHSPFYLVNQPMMNGAAYHIEERPRMRGIGTYFPNVNQYVDSQSIARARNYVLMRSPRSNEHNVFTPDMEFLEGASHEFSSSHPFMPPNEMMHISDNILHESPGLAFPDANCSANSDQGGAVALGSFDRLHLDSSTTAREDSPHQPTNIPFAGSSDPILVTEKPQNLPLGIQERIASKSFRLKNVDDFPPLSS